MRRTNALPAIGAARNLRRPHHPRRPESSSAREANPAPSSRFPAILAGMLDPSPWFVLAGATTLINSSVLGFMSWRESNHALRIWAYAWLAWAAAVVPLAQLEGGRPEPLLALPCGLLWVTSALCFLRGTYEFSERRMPRTWYVVAAGCSALAFALGIGPSGALGMLPLILFQSVGLLATGVLMLRSAGNRAGAWLCGVALVGLGLHLLDAPFVVQIPALLPWGFVVATSLELLTALGMVMLYHEHTRAQLLEAQRALAETRRVEALGRVAGGVAHDFNNMLQVMHGHVELIRMDLHSPEHIEASLNGIELATGQAARLTAQLLAFGRRSVIQPRAIDIRGVVSDTLELLKKLIPERIQVQLRCEHGSYLASMDRTLLEQIVLNLVTNARDAISGSGHIWVELRRASLPSPSVTLKVVDDGMGMDEGVLSQLFEPFFTTKGAARGTGLGLASVQGAVSQLGGQLSVQSQPGHGSTFEVVLPLVAAEERSTPSFDAVSSGALDILVVDDADQVREVTARILKTAGHRVQEAKDGARALDSVRAKAYDLVLTDVVMPHMGGLELLKEVAHLRPETLVVLTSGYPEDADLDRARAHFLAKPFRSSTLLSLVERLVTEHRTLRGSAPAQAPDNVGSAG